MLPVRIICGCVASILPFAAIAANAQLPALQLDTVFPPGGQSGSTVEVTVSGQDLDHLSALTFDHEGITAEHLDGNRFKVTVGSEVPADFYEARITGRFGLSNPRPFEISALPQVNESGEHRTVSTAAAIEMNSVVNGKADAEAIDYFKFHAPAGQRVFIECVADRLDSRMDPTLILTDDAGQEILRDRDTRGRDALLDFTAGEEGDYVVAIHDFQFGGGAHHVYRLIVHTGAQIDWIIPPSANPGKTQRLEIYGRNLPQGQTVHGLMLDGKPIERMEIDLDVPEAPGRPLSRSVAAAGTSGTRITIPDSIRSCTIATTDLPILVEREPNQRSTNAQRVSVPCDIGAQFFPAGDTDWFEFDAMKDKTYWIEVISDRSGRATDPFLAVMKVTRDGNGHEQMATVTEVDDIDEKSGAHWFPAASRDSRASFKADANTRYRVFVRNQFSGNSPGHTYRLIIRHPEPGFSLVAGYRQPTDEGDQLSRTSALLRRGESIQLRVMAHRHDGFNGRIKVGVRDLPQGVTAHPCVIPTGSNDAWLTLVAASDAPNIRRND